MNDLLPNNNNPLHCILCNNIFTDPSVLSCHHVFCGSCIAAKIDTLNDTIRCPICGVTDDCSKLLDDSLVKYFIDSASEEADICSNCDRACQPMFFCETCQQSLCYQCKGLTHQAKMFSSHKIVPLEERSKMHSNLDKCIEHGESFIMFATDEKVLKCIKCFRCAPTEARHNFVDLALACETSCDKLEQLVKNLKSFQKEMEDGITMHQTLLEEVEKSAESEVNGIQNVSQKLIDIIVATREKFIEEVDVSRRTRVAYFENTLITLRAVIPIVQFYALVANIFASSANQVAFLKYSYLLIYRITNLIDRYQQKAPKYTGTINVHFQDEIIRAMEPILCSGNFTPRGSLLAEKMSATGNNSPASSVASWQYRLKHQQHSIEFKVKKIKIGDDTFSLPVSDSNPNDPSEIEDKILFDDKFNELQTSLKSMTKRHVGIRRQLQEIQRDLTIRRSIVDNDRIENVVNDCDLLKEDVERNARMLERYQPRFQTEWQLVANRVNEQQFFFQNYVNELCAIMYEMRQVSVISEHLKPFCSQLSVAVTTASPKRGPDSYCGPMQEICIQIHSIDSDSQSRVDAIEREDTNRKAKQLEQQKKDTPESKLTSLKQKLRVPRDPHRKQQRMEGCSDRVVKGVNRDRGADRSAMGPLSALSPRSSKSSMTSVSAIQSSVESDSSVSPVPSLDGIGTPSPSVVPPPPPPPPTTGIFAMVNSEEMIPIERSATQNMPSSSGICDSTEVIGMSTSLPTIETAVSSSIPDLLVIPSKSRIPENVKIIAQPETIEAKERMLASLRERVKYKDGIEE